MNRAKADLKHLKEDFERLGKTIEVNARDRGEEILDKTKETFQNITDAIKAKAQPVIKSIRAKSYEANKYVNDKPWTSIGIAAASGLMVGLLFNRGRK